MKYFKDILVIMACLIFVVVALTVFTPSYYKKASPVDTLTMPVPVGSGEASPQAEIEIPKDVPMAPTTTENHISHETAHKPIVLGGVISVKPKGEHSMPPMSGEIPKETIRNSTNWSENAGIKLSALKLDAAMSTLRDGRVAFDPPSAMKAGITEKIEVRIASANLLTNKLVEGMVSHGNLRVTNVLIGTFMKARLFAKDDEFTIKALGSEEQYVPWNDFTQWNWDATPLKRGKFTMHLVITVKVKVNGEDGERDLPVMDRNIAVAVNPVFTTKRFCKEHTEWIIGGIGSAILGLLAKLWHARRKKKTVHHKKH